MASFWSSASRCHSRLSLTGQLDGGVHDGSTLVGTELDMNTCEFCSTYLIVGFLLSARACASVISTKNPLTASCQTRRRVPPLWATRPRAAEGMASRGVSSFSTTMYSPVTAPGNCRMPPWPASELHAEATSNDENKYAYRFM